MKRKTILNPTGVEYGDYAINHVDGCYHGCKYCYAFKMCKRFGKVNDYNDWCKPKVVENALELLKNELPKKKDKIKSVFLSFMTDPFPYTQKIFSAEYDSNKLTIHNLSNAIIEELNKNDIKVITLSKGLIYLNLYAKYNEHGASISSLNEDYRKEYEPKTARFEERIYSLLRLAKYGNYTWVSMEPFPTPNMDYKQNLNKLLEHIKFVNKIIFGKLNYSTVDQTAGGYGIDWYKQQAQKVIDFCKQHNIECYIKRGIFND